MSQKIFIVKSLLISFLVVGIILLSSQFANALYDIVSVTPLFFLYFANCFFPFSILLALLGILASFTMKDKILFAFSSFTLYFIIFLAPFNIFRFPIYNDQLGFAVETLYGMHDGIVVPYQGEYSTLGHAFFTSIVGKILGLNLFQATRFVEVFFVIACFIVYLSSAMSILRRQGDRSFLMTIVVIIFPAFALEPLVYSRGYFGLVVSIFLFFCIFKFMERNNAKSFILTTITFLASSISYPLQPLIVVMAMALLVLFSHFITSLSRNKCDFHRAMLGTLMFFAIWSAIQVYGGCGSWNILHEIIRKALAQEFFTALEHPTLQYVGEAAVYTSLRLLMMAAGWLMAAFILLAFTLNFLRNGNVSGIELFAFLLMASFCFLGIIYGITYHEPALRFYRNLIPVMPLVLTHMADRIAVKGLHLKMMSVLLLTIITVFLIFSPVTKWGWTFVGYPKERDIALCSYIISHYESSLNTILYAPGSHALFGFFTKLMSTQAWKNLRVYASGDVEFDLNKSAMAEYTATFYRIYIYPRWYGKDINMAIDEIGVFILQDNVLYSNGELWLLIYKRYL